MCFEPFAFAGAYGKRTLELKRFARESLRVGEHSAERKMPKVQILQVKMRRVKILRVKMQRVKTLKVKSLLTVNCSL